MCGIAGIVGRLDARNDAALKRMNAALAHRGPDAESSWASPPDADGRGVLLTHRRLAILDLSPAGVQPMTDPVTGHVIAYNGEIYNFADLRRRLTDGGQRFASSGDTAVVLRDLALNGPAAIPRFRGMYAFACWNPANRTLLLARDPLGIKPLYIARSTRADSGWSFAFASELRALLASGVLDDVRLDPTSLAAYVWNGFTIGPNTMVAGVELLPTGAALTIDSNGHTVDRTDVWRPRGQASTKPSDEREVADVLQESVKLHLASDVPLAVFLSGGIDSSVVANLAQRTSSSPVHTFTLAFEEKAYDEGPAARRIAVAIGTRHTEVTLTEQDFVAGLDAALDSLDQPTFDAINAYVISKTIREAGFTVALSGTGGDELFGGYPSFRDLPRLHASARFASFVSPDLQSRVAAAATWPVRRSQASVAPQTRWAKLPDMVRHGRDLTSLYQLSYAHFLPSFQRDLLTQGAPPLDDGLPRAMRARLDDETRGRSPLSTIALLEQRIFLGERLLRDNDAASMASSLEQRVPLVDHVLLDAVDRLPDAARFQPLGRKQTLRRIGLTGLDPALFERPKTGFVLPFDRWLRRGVKTRMDAVLRDQALVAPTGLSPDAVARLWQAFLDGAPGIHWSRVWAIFVLCHWCRRHRVSI